MLLVESVSEGAYAHLGCRNVIKCLQIFSMLIDLILGSTEIPRLPFR